MRAWSQRTPTTHLFRLLILVVLSCQCAMAVVSVEWTLRSTTCVVMWLGWNGAVESVFQISIPGTEWLVYDVLKNTDVPSICDKTLVIVCNFMGKFYAKESIKIIITEIVYYTNLSTITQLQFLLKVAS